MSDLLFQELSTVQSDKQATPKTIASAATIVPTTFLTILTGTVQVANITPPVSGTVALLFMFTDANPGALLTTGNILTAYTPIQNRPFWMVWNPLTNKWSPMAVS